MLALQTLKSIGPHYIKRLNEFGIHTSQDLLTHIDSSADLYNLAEDTDISVTLLNSWINLLSLTKLPGMQQDEVAALIQAGVRSISDLASYSAQELEVALHWANLVSRHLPELPRRTVLQTWIDQARQLLIHEASSPPPLAC